jgi:hypothetical protein
MTIRQAFSLSNTQTLLILRKFSHKKSLATRVGNEVGICSEGVSIETKPIFKARPSGKTQSLRVALENGTDGFFLFFNCCTCFHSSSVSWLSGLLNSSFILVLKEQKREEM